MQSNGIPQASQPIDTNLMWATIILTFCLFGLAQPNTRLDFRYSLRLFSVRVAGAIITVRFDSHVIVKNIRTVSSPRGSFSCTPSDFHNHHNSGKHFWFNSNSTKITLYLKLALPTAPPLFNYRGRWGPSLTLWDYGRVNWHAHSMCDIYYWRSCIFQGFIWTEVWVPMDMDIGSTGTTQGDPWHWQ